MPSKGVVAVIAGKRREAFEPEIVTPPFGQAGN